MNIKKYKDKKISILSDSISTFEGVSIPDGGSFARFAVRTFKTNERP